jgi:hypothetical protein
MRRSESLGPLVRHHGQIITVWASQIWGPGYAIGKLCANVWLLLQPTSFLITERSCVQISRRTIESARLAKNNMQDIGEPWAVEHRAK